MIEIKQNNEISYQIQEFPSRPSGIKRVARVYAIVFSGWPWFEVSRGRRCNKFYNASYPPGSNCPCGCGKLQIAYPPGKTVSYIRGELLKPEARGLLVTKKGLENEIIGFSWAFKLSGSNFTQEKYDLAQSRILINSILDSNKDYYYLSEVGVIPDYQAKGVGTRMTEFLVETGLKLNLPILLRTNISSPAAKIARRLSFKPIIGPEMNVSDPENPKRIIFTLS